MSAETWEETYKRLWDEKLRRIRNPREHFRSGYEAGLAAGKELAAKIAEEVGEDHAVCSGVDCVGCEMGRLAARIRKEQP